MDSRYKSITAIREISNKFIKGQIDFDNFYDSVCKELGSEFDPFDDSIEDLDSDLQIELRFYSRLTGGEFGEYKDMIPKNANWEYGLTDEKYGWFDKTEYLSRFKQEFLNLKLYNIDN